MLPGKNSILNLPAGLTMVEIILVIAILGITVFVMMAIFPFGLRTGYQAELTTSANNLAQAKMESLLGSTYDLLTVGTTTEPSLSTIDADFASFSRTTVINYLDANLNISQQDTDLKKIKVIVSWYDPKKQSNRSINLASFVSKQ